MIPPSRCIPNGTSNALSDALAIRNTPLNGSNTHAKLNSPNAFSPSLNPGRGPRAPDLVRVQAIATAETT